jgi:energy-coupling factor transporter ATP-binding protein EcfA2
VRLDRAPGLPDGVALQGLGPGVNLVVGPNASGKSTLARAIRAAVADRVGADALFGAIRFEHRGATLQARWVAGHLHWEPKPPPPPVLDPALAALDLPSLLRATASDQALVRAIATELRGGDDPDAAVAALTGPKSLAHPRRMLQAARSARREAEAQADALADDEARLAALRQTIDAAQVREGDPAWIDAGLRWCDATEALVDAGRVLEALAPHALDLPEGALDEFDQLRHELEAAEQHGARRRDAAALARANAPSPAVAEPARDAALQSARGQLRLLDQAKTEAQRAGVQATRAAAALEALAVDPLAADPLAAFGDSAAAPEPLAAAQRLQVGLEARETARAEAKALQARISGLPTDEGEARAAMDAAAATARALHAWSNSDARVRAATPSPAGWLVVLAAGLLLGLLTLAFEQSLGWTSLAFVTGAGAVGWLASAELRRARAMRDVAAREVEALGIPVTSLDAAGLRAALDAAQQAQAAAALRLHSASQAAGLRADAARVEQVLAAAEAEVRAGAEPLGLAPSLFDLALHDAARRSVEQARWRREWATACAERDAATEQVGVLAEEIAAWVARTGVAAGLADMAPAAAIEAAASALQRQRQALADAERAEADSHAAEKDVAAAERALRSLLVRCGLTRGEATGAPSAAPAPAPVAWTRAVLDAHRDVLGAASRDRDAALRTADAAREAEQRRTEARTRLERARARIEARGLGDWLATVLDDEPGATPTERQVEAIEPARRALHAEAEAARAEVEASAAARSELGALGERLAAAGRATRLTDAIAAEVEAKDGLADARDARAVRWLAERLIGIATERAAHAAAPARLQRAQAWFARFTRQAWELEIEGSGALVARGPDGFVRPAEALSDATRIQLLLALRLAALELAEAGGPPATLCLDEVLATTDPGRYSAVALALAEVAAAGRQVIYFTAQPGEAATFAAALREAGFDAPTIASLGAAQPRALVAPGPVAVDPNLPRPGESTEAWSARLTLPALQRWAPVEAAPLGWLLADRADVLRTLMEGAVTTVGIWRRIAASGEPAALVEAGRAAALPERIRAFEAAWQAAAIGHARPVSWAVVQGSGAVSARYEPEVRALLEGVGDDAAVFLERLGQLRGFRADKLARMAEALREAGLLDARQRLEAEEIVARACVAGGAAVSAALVEMWLRAWQGASQEEGGPLERRG